MSRSRASRSEGPTRGSHRAGWKDGGVFGRPRDVCELALAHLNTNAIEATYRRTNLFEWRRALMEQWSAFLAD